MNNKAMRPTVISHVLRSGWLLRAVAGTVMGAGALQICAQAHGRSVEHTAPLSPRFPASWYPSDTSAASTEAPVTHHPYIAEFFMVSSYRLPNGTMKQIESAAQQMRDSEGRIRSETPVEDPSSLREVTIDDPVSHCHFNWSEPLPATMERSAAVLCYSRTMTRAPGPDMRARLTAGPSETVEGQVRIKREPLPEQVVDGVAALGSRLTRTPLDGKGAVVVNELWWSPDVEEIVLVDSGIGTAQEYKVGLRNIRRTEPDAALFYPPEGYAITH